MEEAFVALGEGEGGEVGEDVEGEVEGEGVVVEVVGGEASEYED